jgi:HEPN domain-containing protein
MKPPERARLDLVRGWIQKANDDLRAAQVLMGDDSRIWSAVGFHSQQAAEKYLKALLTWHQVEFRKTHDLDELLELAGVVAPGVLTPLDEIGVLTRYGVEMRYPGDAPPITEVEAREAMELAQKVSTLVNGLLPGSQGN